MFETFKEFETFSQKFKVPNEVQKSVLDYTTYGFVEADLDRSFYIDIPEWGGMLGMKKHWTLRDLLDSLKHAYCGKIGVEYMHIPYRGEQQFIRDRIETL